MREVVPENQFWKPVCDGHMLFDEPPEEMPAFIYIPCGFQYSDWTEIN